LFRRENQAIHVMNEFIELQAIDISLFSQFVFSNFKSISIIFFSAIKLSAKNLTFPYQKYDSTEDMILNLPGSVPEYLEKLGNSTRRNIKRYVNKIEREHPSFEFKFFEKGAVTQQQIEQIIKYKITAMTKKGKKTRADQLEVGRILDMVKTCEGLIGIAEIDGQIRGGEIICRVGDNYFSMIGAHDLTYDKYSLGTIGCYLTICECIARKGKKFHFLWGRESYKKRLLAVQEEFQNAIVYRSALHMIKNSNVALNELCKASIRKVKFWLLDRIDKHGFISRAAITAMRNIRRIVALSLSLVFILSIDL
jgi:ribosomal protein S8